MASNGFGVGYSPECVDANVVYTRMLEAALFDMTRKNIKNAHSYAVEVARLKTEVNRLLGIVRGLEMDLLIAKGEA